MNIVVLLGSPHKQGTTAQLAAAFIKGAEAAGHSVESVYLAGEKIAPCVSCGACRRTGACVQKDGAPVILEKLMRADGVVFVSPLFYFNMTAQLKALIDRFYSKPALRDKTLKAALLTAGADAEDWTFEAIEAEFKALCLYMRFENAGCVTAYNCASPAAAALPEYLVKAEALGKAF